MKKYIIVIVLIISFVFAYITDYTCAEENKKGVTRGECIMHIMKLIGVDDISADLYADIDFVKPIFADLTYDGPYTGYIIIANLNNIAVGVSYDKSSDINYFESDRNVTVKECLAFVLRSLNEPSNVRWDDSIIYLALDLGLLTEEEADLISFDSELTLDLFETILERVSRRTQGDGSLVSKQMRGQDRLGTSDCVKTHCI